MRVRSLVEEAAAAVGLRVNSKGIGEQYSCAVPSKAIFVLASDPTKLP